MISHNYTERATQNRVINLFQELGYQYLGNWQDNPHNSNIHKVLVSQYLSSRGYTSEHISKALNKLLEAGRITSNKSLYKANKEVYDLLRYGVGVKVGGNNDTERVWFIDWDHPEANHFGIAEEVTLKGPLERRPDLVLYVNGIAIGVLELKRGSVSVQEAISQLLSNQQPAWNDWFFTTVQFCFAGSDTEGLHYGTTLTPSKYYLKWKEDEHDNDGYKLDKYLSKMCRKDRLIELMHDYVVFDGGTKKLPRVHQYFGVKKAQEFINRKEGGIIWHTQGSGKSITMVLLAKWILEHRPQARVVIITDREELEHQIIHVLKNTKLIEDQISVQASSGRDLLTKLQENTPKIICTLVHKFGQRNVSDWEAFISELEQNPIPVTGEFFVFVDECHRTQGGWLNRAMKAIIPDGVIIGFTGTPLLKADKKTTHEVFGRYIHRYQFQEAVEDNVVLDLVYEARDIDQRINSQEHIDLWFDAKTKALNDWQKDELKKTWANMQVLMSSRNRMEQVIADIIMDFASKPNLSNGRGNAILVASSIYDASKYYHLLQQTEFKGKCAIITSYNPNAQSGSKEEIGTNTETDKQFILKVYEELLKGKTAAPGKTVAETYELDAKRLFIEEPANMKLLVVVNKLLTGFDAPPCTFIYLDQKMQDHGLFQAICRVNRLNGEDKQFGYVVDYKDLFRKVERAIAVYTSELEPVEGDDKGGQIELKDRLTIGKERLDDAMETVAALLEPVDPPKGVLEYQRYFCGNPEIATDLEEKEPERMALYKASVQLIRAYANIKEDLDRAGYSPDQVKRIHTQVEEIKEIRERIRIAAGEFLDLKPFEADMRHLLDTYIAADPAKKISAFGNMGLLEIIVKSGIGEAIAKQLDGLKGDRKAIAETIENNVRSKIIKDRANDPAFYEKMSALLDEIIQWRKENADNYAEYLVQIAELAKKVSEGFDGKTPVELNTPGKRALWGSLNQDVDLSLKLDTIIRENRQDDWVGNRFKERALKKHIYKVVNDSDKVDEVFEVIKVQPEYAHGR